MEGPHVQSLVYSMVARGDVMLSQYSAFPSASTSFAAVAAACLPKLSVDASASASSSAVCLPKLGVDASSSSSSPSASSKSVVSYKCDGYTFHFLVQDGFTYLVVSSNLEGEQIASTFLSRIKEDFYKRYGDAPTDHERFLARSLEKDFGPRLKEHMQYCLDNFQILKSLASMRDQVLEVKETIAENIEKVLESNDSIHLQIESMDVHHAHAENFHRQGQQLKRKMQRRQIKLRLLVLSVSTILILSIWLLTCKGFKC